MFRPLLCSIIGFACLIGGAAQAAQPVGVTVDASTTVTGSGPAGSREIRKDSAIFQDDRLKATKSGNAQIILVDKTKIVVGPGAQVDIDNFVFNSDDTFKTVTIRATKGAFRFVSGNSGHSRLQDRDSLRHHRRARHRIRRRRRQWPDPCGDGSRRGGNVRAWRQVRTPARALLIRRDGCRKGRSGRQSAAEGTRRKGELPADER